MLKVNLSSRKIQLLQMVSAQCNAPPHPADEAFQNNLPKTSVQTVIPI